MRYLIFTLLLSFSVLYSQNNSKGNMHLIPMKDFFKNPEKASFQISPNGEYLSFMMPYKSRMNVFIQKVGSDDAVRITSAEERDISGYFWASNNRIVYMKDKGGDENFHMFAVGIDGQTEIDLTPYDKVRVEIVDDLEDIDDEMIISMNKNNPQLFDVYRINIISGEMKEIAKNPGNITSWVTDHEGKVRIATTTDGVNNTLLYRKSESDEFQPVLTTNFKESLSPLMFDFKNEFIYMLSNINRDKLAIVLYDMEKKSEIKMVYENQDVDVANLLSSNKRKVITGASFVKAKREYVFWDKETQKEFELLQKLLPGYEVTVISSNKNEDKMLVRTFSDKSRGSYYFFDSKSEKITKLAEATPWLKENELCDMKPVTYKTRDGLIVNGYLTLPKNGEGKNLPVVVNPHGGPWYRDNWGFNPEVQFLANRGYAVFQMNFRGSTGYGKQFWSCSFKEWGKKMQDDISDGVKYLINEGIADPKRVAIYGGSYGGYATLAGMTFTPELYACGVDYVGVSNLFTFMNSIPPYWKPYLDMLYEMVGHPENDKDMLTATSPVFHVDKITSPLMVAQGANDPRVAKAESDQMVEALKKRGIDVPYMVKDNEGHGFHNEENRFDFYRAMEVFFGKYLGGKVE